MDDLELVSLLQKSGASSSAESISPPGRMIPVSFSPQRCDKIWTKKRMCDLSRTNTFLDGQNKHARLLSLVSCRGFSANWNLFVQRVFKAWVNIEKGEICLCSTWYGRWYSKWWLTTVLRSCSWSVLDRLSCSRSRNWASDTYIALAEGRKAPLARQNRSVTISHRSLTTLGAARSSAWADPSASRSMAMSKLKNPSTVIRINDHVHSVKIQAGAAWENCKCSLVRQVTGERNHALRSPYWERYKPILWLNADLKLCWPTQMIWEIVFSAPNSESD